MRSTQATTLDVEWNGVSEQRPCAICGGGSECRRHAVDAFASCARQPSDWPLTNGAWLHRIVDSARS